jgi:ATP-binding cassette, subfamily B, bacterial
MNPLLQQCSWPASRLGEALSVLAQHSRLATREVDVPVPEPHVVADPELTGSWIESTAAWLGIEAHAVESPYIGVDQLLAKAGPAVLRLPGDEPRFVLLARSRTRRPRLLSPDLKLVPVALDVLRAALCAELERPVVGEVDRLLDVAEVPPRRRARTRQRMLRDHIVNRVVDGCWLLHAGAGASFLRQLAQAGCARYLALLLATFSAQFGLYVLSWWLIGRAVLAGTMDRGLLAGWALILGTMTLISLAASWSVGMLTLHIGGAIKQRLLAGALRLAPEEIRQQGAGQLLGRVLQSSEFESLSLSGGIQVLMCALELLAALPILAQGAGGATHILLLAAMLGLGAAVVIMHWRAYQGRMDVRLDLTHELVEKMVGHRTCLAQEDRRRWHDREDQLLDQYFRLFQRTDRAAVILTTIVPRGWLLVGMVGLLPALLDGQPTSGSLAVAVGGVLLVYNTFRRAAVGVIPLIEARITWSRVVEMFKASRRPVDPASPTVALRHRAGVAAVGAELLSAHDLQFRYGDRARPVLQNLDLQIRIGDRILLEGPSGSGKSTLGAVLAGLRTASAGLLLLHGLDLRTLAAAGWRRRVVMAPQFHENHIFVGTFAFNLMMGRRWPAREDDLEEAQAICRELGLGGLLDRMPSGLQQMLGETGWQLSHGERSRVYIARALLQRPDLLILDESFAALDPETLRISLDCVLRRASSLLVIAHP